MHALFVIRGTLADYAVHLQEIADPREGCVAKFLSANGPEVLDEKMDFILHCTAKYFGAQFQGITTCILIIYLKMISFPGIPCYYDADCENGVKCDNSVGLCNYSNDHVVQVPLPSFPALFLKCRCLYLFKF